MDDQTADHPWVLVEVIGADGLQLWRMHPAGIYAIASLRASGRDAACESFLKEFQRSGLADRLSDLVE
jgi:hypothetical protein